MPTGDGDQHRDELLRAAARAYLDFVQVAYKPTWRDLPLWFWLKMVYIVAVVLVLWALYFLGPPWVAIALWPLFVGWTTWMVWANRARPCVICQRATRHVVPSFSYVRPTFFDFTPRPDRMFVHVCREHENDLLITHFVQQLRRPEQI